MGEKTDTVAGMELTRGKMISDRHSSFLSEMGSDEAFCAE